MKSELRRIKMDSLFKQFMYGLDQSRAGGGMKWYGKIPDEVIELYGIDYDSLKHGYNIAGVYVECRPQYEPFKIERKDSDDTR